MLLLFKHSHTDVGVFPAVSLHGLVSMPSCPAQMTIVSHGELTGLSLPLAQVTFFNVHL